MPQALGLVLGDTDEITAFLPGFMLQWASVDRVSES